jgi:predicted dehydrogenase/threonine dehydrogenase-like Zn-dependent dehydrogenase
VKQVLIRSGAVVVEDVPAPAAAPGHVLVSVRHSCISAGTELEKVRLSGVPLYRRALEQPHHARRVLDIARDEGLVRTAKRVRGALAGGLPTGYSAAGVVVGVGEGVTGFAAGDRVACAGGGIANHAELIDVPVNLAVRIPDGLGTEAAATCTLGAIALQGVRRAAPTLGESVLVVGLGILGQLTVQLLRAAGARPIGTDVDPRRIDVARAAGLELAVEPGASLPERVAALTDGFGADAAILTAATRSSEIVRAAMQACRKKGRVVVVGEVGLDLRREDMYERELDLLMSTSYGPGRYDPVYELEGQDYPLPYVRWTENRNIEEYLSLLAEGRVTLEPLPTQAFHVDHAADAFAALAGEERPLLVLLAYPEREAASRRVTVLRRAEPARGRVRVALVGAGSFAEGYHIPSLAKLSEDFELRAVVGRTGARAKSVAAAAGAAYATTDLDAALSDDEVDLVLIATRHDLHAPFALRALEAGKHVFVEKPLALSEQELAAVEAFYADREGGPLLMTGFNRRFSPPAVRLRELLAGRATPLVASYRMNAGYLAPDHWVHGPEGGGRNVGEACHVYDLFDFLTGAGVTGVTATAIDSRSRRLLQNDNFSATIAYDDGSVCTLTYTALGNRSHPKEQLELFCDGAVYTLADYKSLRVAGRKARGWRSQTVKKGHLEELAALRDALRHGGAWPITLEEQLQASRIALEVEALLGRPQGAREARARPAASKACGQSTQGWDRRDSGTKLGAEALRQRSHDPFP